MKVLVTGASGYLGQHLLLALHAAGHELHCAFGSFSAFADGLQIPMSLYPLDISSEEAVRLLLVETSPDIVVHCAAISSPAVCQRDAARARAVNCPQTLVDALPANAGIIFLSTDQVYDGLCAPYTEDSAVRPVNEYGQSKLAFEEVLRARLPLRHVSLRSSPIVGGTTPSACRKQSFFQFCDERLGPDGIATDFFSDEIRSVVLVDDVTTTITALIRLVSPTGITSAPTGILPGSAATAPGSPVSLSGTPGAPTGISGGAGSPEGRLLAWANIAGVYNMGGPHGVSRVDVAREVASLRGHGASKINPVERFAPGAPKQAGGVASPPDITMDSSRLATLTGVEFSSLACAVRVSLVEAEQQQQVQF